MTASREQASWHPRAAWQPHAWDPPPFSLPIPPLPHCRRAARSPLKRDRVDSSSRASPLLSDPSSQASELPHRSPHPDHHQRPPAAPSSSWISAEHRRHPPLPGELLPELPIPKISCKSLTPELQDFITPTSDHRSPLPADEHRRPTPLVPPHRRPAVSVRPCPLLLARHLPHDPLEITGNTLPPSSHRRAAGEHATAPSRARCSRPRRPVAPLGWAARPWPSRCFGRPRVAGRRAPWALASGRFQPGTVLRILNVFPIVLNHRN
jgi:hypothetical protein